MSLRLKGPQDDLRVSEWGAIHGIFWQALQIAKSDAAIPLAQGIGEDSAEYGV